MGSIKEINYQELRLNEVELSPVIQAIRRDLLKGINPFGFVLNVSVPIQSIEQVIEPIYAEYSAWDAFDVVSKGKNIPRPVQYTPSERFVVYCRLMNWHVQEDYGIGAYQLKIHSGEAFNLNHRILCK